MGRITPTLRVLIGCICLAFAPLAAAQSTVQPPDFAAIDAYVETMMRDDRVPGVALAIVHHDAIVHLRGYGEDGYGRAVTPQTSFILGSMSKSFTALAIMQLVERDLVNLDAPVQQYLPWFRVADADAAAQITVRHLLDHTSGIPTRTPQATGETVMLTDHVRALADVALNHPPGSVHEYSSANYLVLGALIEQVTGQPYAAAIEEFIFTPLQMRTSFTSQAQAIDQGMAQGHRYWFGFPVPVTLPYESARMPTAALISTAEDLGQYLVLQLNAGRAGEQTLLAPEYMAQMHTPSAPSDGFAYGFGWRVSTMHGVPMIHHGGIVPHFRGKMVFLPEQQWGVVVLTNASTSLPLPITPTSHRMADSIAAALIGQPLTSSSYTQSLLSTALTLGMALVILNQISGLIRIKRWQAGLATRSRPSIILDVAVELLWPLIVLIGLPFLIGLPWSAILQGTPDMAIWLIASISIGVLTGVVKVIALRRNTRMNGSLHAAG